ncbi:MAG: hypothetical protein RR652_03125, partial [Mucinivorans sp.]
IEMWATAKTLAVQQMQTARRATAKCEIRQTARCQRRSEQIAVTAPCRIVTFEKVTQNFL